VPIVIALGVGVTAAAKQKKQSSSGPRQGSSSASASASASSNSDPVEDSSLGLADEEDGSSGGRLLPGKDGGEGVPADGNALSCFGIVTLASLLPVLTVLMLGFWLLATQVVLVWVCCRYECLMILVWAVAGGNYRGRRSGQGQVRFASSLAAPSQQMLTRRAPPSGQCNFNFNPVVPDLALVRPHRRIPRANAAGPLHGRGAEVRPRSSLYYLIWLNLPAL
jgi:hypothetical protein